MGQRSKKRLAAYRQIINESGSIICGLCLKPILFRDDVTVDHIVPRARGGNSRLSNLQPAHGRCNNQKADKLINILSQSESHHRVIDMLTEDLKPDQSAADAPKS